MPNGQHTIIDVHVLLVRGDELLLTQRRGNYGGGMWHLPSGKLDAGESLTAGAAREAAEEVGVHIDPADLRHVHTVHVANSGPVPPRRLLRGWPLDRAAPQSRAREMLSRPVVPPRPPA